ncbi:MAG: hypothetical protein CM1200mP29_09450 [Verrucomicrobiota bacterium]|nr:MAG: hypothetical protein CM1200mP29_09450 [Verrucomicrobiota bacterium]
MKKGLEVEAQVLEVDQENQRISVGIKQLAEDPWDKIDDLYKIGDLVEGKVSKLASLARSSDWSMTSTAWCTSARLARSGRENQGCPERG